MYRRLLALLAIACAALSAHATEEFARHALTVPMVEKYNAAARELEKTAKRKDQEDEEDEEDMSLEEIVKMLDSTPGVKPVLQRHGLTSRTYALTTMALFQAGFYLAMEPSMDKKKGAALLASYPPETRANIELLRKNPQLLRKAK